VPFAAATSRAAAIVAQCTGFDPPTTTSAIAAPPLLLLPLLLSNFNPCPVYDAQSTSLWSSNSTALGVGPRQLALQNDGNLVLLDANLVPIWETNTGGMFEQWSGQMLT
jgi:hypothetical protein